jgi:glucose/arabinose dehydrogenase
VFAGNELWTYFDSVDTRGENGLLALATDGVNRIWALYVRGDRRVTLVEIQPDERDIDPVTVFAQQVGNKHAAGGMVYSHATKRLYVGLGDDQRGDWIMTDPEYEFGSLWSVDPVTGVRQQIATGVRNPWALELLPGGLWFVDPGESTWEEINLLDLTFADADDDDVPHYGWPCYEGSRPADWTSGKCGTLVKVDAVHQYRYLGGSVVGVAAQGADVWYADFVGDVRRLSGDSLVKRFDSKIVRMKMVQGDIVVITVDGNVYRYR